MNFSELTSSLSHINSNKILFVALGNKLRGDDGISFHFVYKLKKTREFQFSNFLDVGANPENYLSKMLSYGPELIVFIDAARFGGIPGEISWLRNDEVNSVNISTHAFSMKLVEDFLLSEQDITIKYLGIEPLNTEFGEHISSELKNRINRFFSN